MDKMKTNGAMLEQIDLTQVPRSAFDLSNHNYLTGKLGAIIPTRVKEVSPGDKLEGSVHIVTNFEPMAAPIMANMVQKEESFFIPYEVIWDKAHRFFTGKKGFNASMPSVTLKRLLDVISGYGLIINDEQFSNIVDIEYNTDRTEIIAIRLHRGELEQVHNNLLNAIQQVGTDNYMLDILYRLRERTISNYNHILDVHDVSVADGYLVPDPKAIDDEILNAYIKYFADIYNYWFGPSSMLDYMGVIMYDFTEMFRSIFGFMAYNTSLAVRNVFVPSDYFKSEIPINWMALRAAYWCWYWNYRDQLIELNVLDPEEDMRSSTISAEEILNCLVVRQRCWFKDTYTTALTETGDGNLVVPTALGVLENTTSLKITEVVQQLDNTKNEQGAVNAGTNITRIKVGDITYDVPSRYLSLPSSVSSPIDSTTTYGLSLDLFDRFKRLSSWISKRLILGTEYDDVIYSSFMVKLSNVEMRVPQILSAGRTQVSINVVVNNTTTAEQIAGDKTAVAWADNQDDMDSQNYFAEQHGLCLHFMTIMPIPSYPQGIQRHYLRQNRFDYYWPEFSQLGFDAVYNIELTGLFPVGTSAPHLDKNLLAVFGYQGRYYDYKMSQDEQHGRLLTDLSYLTFGRRFGSFTPVTGVEQPDIYEQAKLNYIFVHCWPSLEPFVMNDRFEDVFRSDVHFRSGWERPIPVPSKVLR